MYALASEYLFCFLFASRCIYPLLKKTDLLDIFSISASFMIRLFAGEFIAVSTYPFGCG